MCKPVSRPVNRAVNHCDLCVNRCKLLKKEELPLPFLFLNEFNGLHANYNGLQHGLQDGLHGSQTVYTKMYVKCSPIAKVCTTILL